MSAKFDEIKDFLENRMRMTHIYQPVMLRQLLDNNGESKASEVAKAFLVHDQTQLEYYETITKRYPGQVLQRRGITSRLKDHYTVLGFDDLSQEEVKELKDICSSKLDAFLSSKRTNPWGHRRKSSGYISGAKKYEVLKNAKHRCLLCGVPADQKALEADHIVPKEWGGSDDITNLQALCYSCNSMKRDKDDADFRDIEQQYQVRQEGCDFCASGSKPKLSEDLLAYSTDTNISDEVLIVPKRHVEDYFELFQPELNAIQRILTSTKESLQKSDLSIIGFKVSFESCGRDDLEGQHTFLRMKV